MPNVLTLEENHCKDCYKCIRTCAVKAIRFENGRAEIIPQECVLCGRCFVVCPQKAKRVRSDVEQVRRAVQAGKRVVCSLAPSFIADFAVEGLTDMAAALRQLGFAEVTETAVGAQFVSDAYAAALEGEAPRALITSCCPAVNSLIQKYYPTLLPFLAKTLSPMQAHCKALKERDPACYTVFVGPCIAKKDEGDQSPYVDAVLTYDELRDWLQDKGLELPQREVAPQNGARARFYPTTGGILKATNKVEGYRRVAIDGIENCQAVLEEMQTSLPDGLFLEMSACEGGCVNGPCIREHRERRLRGALRVDSFAGDDRFDEPSPADIGHSFAFLGVQRVKPGAAAIEATLRKMGKLTPEDELNCGSCGYNTCREKAAAVLAGKAEITMCLPYLKSKAESFSDTILRNMPSAVLVLDDQLRVQQMNPAAVELFRLRTEDDLLREPIERLMDPEPFHTALLEMRGLSNQLRFLPEYDRYVEQSVLCDRQSNVLVVLLRDVTQRERRRQSDEALQKRTAEVTGQVIEKQMRAVQEIASLLGETTAETQIALTQLKDALHGQEGSDAP